MTQQIKWLKKIREVTGKEERGREGGDIQKEKGEGRGGEGRGGEGRGGNTRVPGVNKDAEQWELTHCACGDAKQ